MKLIKQKKVFYNSLVVLGALIVVYPIFMMLMISFKTDAEFILSPFSIPQQFNISNYTTAMEQMEYWNALKNSVFLTATSSILCTVLCATTAYGLVRAQRGKKLFQNISRFFWFGIALPQQVAMVPLVLWMNKLGLGGNIFGLILVYIAAEAAFGVFFFSGFVNSVPVSLEEAAYIDGAGRFTTFRCIVFPLLKTPMVTLLIIIVLRIYNNFIYPLILLQGADSRTLPLTIYFFKGDTSVQWTVMFAATTLVILPLLIAYFFFQKQIIDGMLSGSVKM